MTKTAEYQKANSCDGEYHSPITKRSHFFNPLVFLALFSIITFFEATAMYGYFGGVLTTIERRFQISSTTVGTLSTISEISALSVLVFVCYFGAKLHIPRIIGASGILFGIGLLLTALPHVLFEPYQPTGGYGSYAANNTESTLMCSSSNKEHVCTEEETEDVKYGQLIDIWPIAVGQVILGFGTAAIYPLSILYLDDSTTDSSTTGLYIALLYVIVSAGPFAGFSISSNVLAYRTDFYKHNDTSVQADGTGSIGAWWLGFVILGILTIVFSIPISFFPRKPIVWESSCMSRFRRQQAEDEFDMVATYRSLQADDKGLLSLIKGFLISLKRIATNVIFVPLILGCCAAASSGTGILFFFAKYLETQFDQDPANAAFFTGVVMLPGTLLGIIVGGVLTSCLQLRMNGLCRLLLLLSFSSILITVCTMFIKCPQRDIAGFTTSYNTHSINSTLPDEVCNVDCACPSDLYQPICSPDGITYISACHAGCVMSENLNDDEDTNISDIVGFCNCFSTNNTVTSENMATEGACHRNCDKLVLMMAVTIFGSFLTSIMWNPVTMLVIRCVDLNDRALGMGCFGLSYRVLALIPAPIYFGAIIQSTCILRSSACGQEGACLIYDTDVYRVRYFGLQVGLYILAFCFFFVTLVSLKRKLSASKHTALDTYNPDDKVDDLTTKI
ncbi:solute carrier organic anion transporter family member 2A1-like [Antedon mediterranea]|uniref:solute carrier organic anion transporter family member 2A1-like n=1 Tax=Antedon mediterranea TaxID=105859 RepID=UPI003AF431EF